MKKDQNKTGGRGRERAPGTQRDLRLKRLTGDHKNTTAAANELGEFQFCVLVAIRNLSPNATLNDVLKLIMEKTKDLPDVAQTYVAIEKFKKEDRKWVVESGIVPSREGGRAVPSLAITDKGREALESKIAHMARLTKFARLMT